MANSKITLDVGTKYNGEGLKKLENAMKQAGGQAKNASKSLGAVS